MLFPPLLACFAAVGMEVMLWERKKKILELLILRCDEKLWSDETVELLGVYVFCSFLFFPFWADLDSCRQYHSCNLLGSLMPLLSSPKSILAFVFQFNRCLLYIFS